MCEKQLKIIAEEWYFMEYSSILYENLVLLRLYGIGMLAIIIMMAINEFDYYCQNHPSKKVKKQKPFFYSGTFDEFVHDNKM